MEANNEVICTGSKKPKQCLTLQDKLEILQFYDSMKGNIKINQLARTLEISRTTLLTIVNNRICIENAPESDRHRFRTRNKKENPQFGKSKYQIMDEALWKWVKHELDKDEAVNGVALKKKALLLAKELGFSSFTASNGWCDRFKKKYKFKYKSKLYFCDHFLPKPNSLDSSINFLEQIQQNSASERQTLKKASRLKEVEIYLSEWLDLVIANGAKVTGILFKEMALNIAGIVGATEFTASNSWIEKFYAKYQKTCKNKCRLCQQHSRNTQGQKVAFPDRKEDKSDENDSICADEFSFTQKDENIEDYDKDSNLTTLLEKPTCIDKLNRLEHFLRISSKVKQVDESRKTNQRFELLKLQVEVLKTSIEVLGLEKVNLKLEIENLNVELQILKHEL